MLSMFGPQPRGVYLLSFPVRPLCRRSDSLTYPGSTRSTRLKATHSAREKILLSGEKRTSPAARLAKDGRTDLNSPSEAGSKSHVSTPLSARQFIRPGLLVVDHISRHGFAVSRGAHTANGNYHPREAFACRVRKCHDKLVQLWCDHDQDADETGRPECGHARSASSGCAGFRSPFARCSSTRQRRHRGHQLEQEIGTEMTTTGTPAFHNSVCRTVLPRRNMPNMNSRADTIEIPRATFTSVALPTSRPCSDSGAGGKRQALSRAWQVGFVPGVFSDASLRCAARLDLPDGACRIADGNRNSQSESA